MNNYISNIFVIFILWCLIIFVQVFFPNSIGSAQYNYYLVVVSAFICFYLNPDIKVFLLGIVFLSVLVLVSKDLIHPLCDFAIFIIIICSLNISLNSNFTSNELKATVFMTLLFVLSDLIGLAFPSLYSYGVDGLRYNGLLHSKNVTATVFSLCLIAYYEGEKHSSHEKRILLMSVIFFVIMLFFSKTRSLFFFAPYWFVQLLKQFKKYAIFFAIIIVFIITMDAFSYFLSNLRLKEDGSSLTRLNLYKAMIEGIKENYLIIPHGSNAANLLSKYITRSPNFSPHNDILRYIYDWGIMFFVVVGIMFRKVTNNYKIDISFLCLVIGWVSGCLHNIMLLPQTYLIFMVACNLYFKNNNVNKKNYEKGSIDSFS